MDISSHEASRILIGTTLDVLEPLWSAIRSAIIFAGHMLLAACVGVMFWGFEWGWRYIYGTDEPLLLGRLRVRYIFEVGDGLILILFICFGLLEATDSFLKDRRERRKREESRSN